MRYQIEIAAEAMLDISIAKNWYEEKQLGLGESFVENIKQHLESLRTDTIEHAPGLNNLRRLLVKRFPYIIYYKRNEVEKVVKVYAVLHDRQNKQIIENRLK